MKTEKMSFNNIKDVLSRDEMKSIMAGMRDKNTKCTTYCKNENNEIVGEVTSESCPGNCSAFRDVAYSACTCI